MFPINLKNMNFRQAIQKNGPMVVCTTGWPSGLHIRAGRQSTNWHGPTLFCSSSAHLFLQPAENSCFLTGNTALQPSICRQNIQYT